MFTSARLRYSRFTPAEFPAYFAMASDPEMMQYIFGRAMTEDEARQRYARGLGFEGTHNLAGIFAVRLHGNDRIIGLAKIEITASGAPEIGYMIEQPLWGQGFATEISRTLIQAIQERGEFRQIVAIVDPRNQASIHILTSLGFTLLSTHTGPVLDSAWYGLEI